MINFDGSGTAPGDLDVSWHAGWPSAKHDPAPEIQVHAYNDHTVILRQNKSVHFEAPFMFLLFGNEQAVLVDTGATAEEEYFPLRRTVDGLITGWLKQHPREGYGLTVVHTHNHGDHKAGDPQFASRPQTTIVGPDQASVVAHYGFDDWPNTSRKIDLGARVVEVIPGPGHEEAATVFYDRYTGLLLTGDTLGRFRLYVQDWSTFTTTIDRLTEFSAVNPVTHILGCHIEMSTTPGQDYPRGWNYQPDEPPLEMDTGHLHALRAAIDEVGDRTGVYPFDDFIIYRND